MFSPNIKNTKMKRFKCNNIQKYVTLDLLNYMNLSP